MVLLGEVDDSTRALDKGVEVTLEELESIIEKEKKFHMSGGRQKTEITWDFDMDLL